MRRVDVVVVGAGLAGLSAARSLAGEADVLVLEARERVGGRTVGHTFPNGCSVEMGGQWVGSAHTELLRLTRELGLETFPTYDEGAGLTVLDGQRRQWLDETIGLPDSTAREIGRVTDSLGALAERVDLNAPWRVPEAEALDQRTVESWLSEATADPLAQAYFRVITPAVFAAETHEVPLLHFLFYVRSGGSLDYLVTTAGGAQESRIVGGTHRICEEMAAGLGSDRVILGAPVDAIEQDAHAARVIHGADVTETRRVIVTLPPALAGRLRYRPSLPSGRDTLTQRYPMGRVIKVQLLYDEPFWRTDGLNGQVLSFDDPIATTFDNSPPDGRCGVLMGFAEAEHARRLGQLDLVTRRRSVVDCMVRFFGPRASDVRDYIELDWTAEEYTRGCYGGRPAAGVWTGYGSALTEPIGRIHWAGAETSPVSNGYMDGAVRSGLRAAAVVLSS